MQGPGVPINHNNSSLNSYAAVAKGNARGFKFNSDRSRDVSQGNSQRPALPVPQTGAESAAHGMDAKRYDKLCRDAKNSHNNSNM